MRSYLKILMGFPTHPVLIAIYFVLSLFAINIDQIKAIAVIRSLVISPVFASLLWLFLLFLCKDWQRSAALATIYLGLFFSYGHVYHFLEVNSFLGLELGRHRILIITFLAIACLSSWVVGYKLRALNNTTKFFNLVSVVLLLFPIYQIAVFNLRQAMFRQHTPYPASASGDMQLLTTQLQPDIYYIILDGYSRPDILLENFDFDDSAFINELQRMGFYIATCSKANYTQTLLSITSSLNLNYVNSLGLKNLENSDSSILFPLIDHNAVRQLFRQLGYSIVGFETGYYWLNQEDVDVYYSVEKKAANPGEGRIKVNGFEKMLIRQSAGLVLTDLLSILPNNLQPDLDYPDRYHREMILYDFEKLYDVPLEVNSPKFVYTHIVAPHPPIVFGPKGEWVNLPENLDDAGWRRAYTGEIQYVNLRILQIVREIISISAISPIIIIQADHGAMISDQENYPEILNAYYLPGGGDARLYPTVSPINTFRIIFDQYFGGKYPLLEDTTYISLYNTPFEFTQSINSCP